MKQIHFQSRLHIVSWLEKTCPRKAIVRALREGQVEFFGGFNPVPPTTDPGWIIRVTSVYGKIWYIAIIAYRDHYGIRILKDVFWGSWVGTFPQGTPRTQLFSGDNPEDYLKLRKIWKEKNGTKNNS